MRVKVEYYGQIAELIALQQESVELELGITIFGFVENLKLRAPQLESMRISVAVNGAFTSLDTVLKNDDNLAIMPPFSGG
jgi:molybdopterin synthase sulfur carrier subunit